MLGLDFWSINCIYKNHGNEQLLCDVQALEDLCPEECLFGL